MIDLGGREDFMKEVLAISMASDGAVTYSELMEMPIHEILVVGKAVMELMEKKHS